MGSITLFAAATNATGQQLDDDLSLTSAQAPIPCSASGSNVIALVQKANTYPVTGYTNNMQFSGVASATNTGAVTAQLGSLGALQVYKDTIAGPVALTGGEIVSGNAFTLMYDPALNGGTGGFHLFTGTQDVGQQINPASIITNGIQFGSSLAATMSRYLTSLASVSFAAIAAQGSQDFDLPMPGALPNDAIMVGPPSLAAAAVAFTGFVAASGTVRLRAVNAGSASINISGSFRVTGIG